MTNIYQRINAVMSECDYLQKKQAQQGKGIKYDEVMAMIRDLLIKHGIVMVIRQTEMESMGGVEGTKQQVYQGRYEMDLINMDEPSEIVTHSTYAHGMDGGDKAPGKAQTYAVKIMLVKGFGIETGEDEESRAEKLEKLRTIDQQQADTLAKDCYTYENGRVSGWTDIGLRIAKAYKVNDISELPASEYNKILAGIKKAKEQNNGNN